MVPVILVVLVLVVLAVMVGQLREGLSHQIITSDTSRHYHHTVSHDYESHKNSPLISRRKVDNWVGEGSRVV